MSIGKQPFWSGTHTRDATLFWQTYPGPFAMAVPGFFLWAISTTFLPARWRVALRSGFHCFIAFGSPLRPRPFPIAPEFFLPVLPNKPLQARHSWLGDRFPPRSHIDANGQPLAYVHFEHEAGQADGDPSLTRDEAR